MAIARGYSHQLNFEENAMNSWRFFRRCLFCLALVSAAVRLNPAQGLSGQISGTIRDAQGARIPGVAVVAVNEQTQFERTGVSDEDGFYVLTNLPPGSYRVTVEHAGFKK